MPLPHRVVIAVFPDVDLLDVTGPAEVFALANRQAAGRARYQVRLAGPGAGEVRTSAGGRLRARPGVVGVGGVGGPRVGG
ncbi:AraC family transcriptional regulator, partial [Streptomyces lasiicapitis]